MIISGNSRLKVLTKNFYNDVNAYLLQLAVEAGAEILRISKDRFQINLPEKGRMLIILKKIAFPGKETATVLHVPEEDFPERCCYLWEDIWQFHNAKVKSKLKSLFGCNQRIHGRQCVLRVINNDVLIKFLIENHLNVPIRGKYKYGLYHQGEIVAVMSFSKGRPIHRFGSIYNSYELLRFCNKLDTTVVGGFSKLLRHFIKNVKPDDIMTYVDREWSDGSLYEKMGFVLEDKTGPIAFRLNTENGERIYPDRLPKSMRIPGSDIETRELPKVYSMGSYKYLLLVKKANSIYQ